MSNPAKRGFGFAGFSLAQAKKPKLAAFNEDEANEKAAAPKDAPAASVCYIFCFI